MLDMDPNAVKEYGGWFGFESFGDSNVDFWLFVQATSRLASFELQSALMKNLHQRLAEEGIVINYPVRTLQLPDGLNPDTVLRGNDPSRAVGAVRSAGAPGRNQRRRRRTPQRGTQVFRDSDVPGGDSPDAGGPDGP